MASWKEDGLVTLLCLLLSVVAEERPTPPDAANTGFSEDFAATSIASDMAGYRSRIFTAYSQEGLVWERERAGCVIEGGGYNSDELDAVHSLRICRWSKSETVSTVCTMRRAIATGTGESPVPLPKKPGTPVRIVGGRPGKIAGYCTTGLTAHGNQRRREEGKPT